MTQIPDERLLRQQLVTCTRLLVHCQILDYSGHLSARLPGTDTILVQPRDASRAALTADDLLVVDLQGAVISGDGPPPSETAIHTAVYRARPDVTFVCHGHPTLSTTFTMVDQPLLPMRHFAYKFPEGLAVHPDPTHIVTPEQGDALARTLGSAGACLLRSHGTLVVSTTVQELFMDCLDIEENARTLLMAMQLGKILPLTADEVVAIGASYNRSRHRPNKLWEHYIYKGTAAGVLES
ncbi:MAG TPA: class II aldolase/adducin family protein [Nakamurella sp.]|nr:class II aldolase/adducin family protein [Nakamurella sp.]